MAVGPADQQSSVLVPNPLGDGHVVGTVHDTVADEVVTTVVEPYVRQAGIVARHDERLAKARRVAAFPAPLG